MTEPTGIEAEPKRAEDGAAPADPAVRRFRFFRGFRRIWHGLHFVGVLAAGIAVFVALVRAKAPPEILDMTLPPLPVAAATAQEGDHPSTIIAYGEVVARRSADVRAIVGGPILRVSDHFANGAPVGGGRGPDRTGPVRVRASGRGNGRRGAGSGSPTARKPGDQSPPIGPS